jgi:hypothetical protein
VEITPAQIVILSALVSLLWGGFMQINQPARMADVYTSEMGVAEKWLVRTRAEQLYFTASRVTATFFDAQAQNRPPEDVEQLELRITGRSVQDLEPILTQALFRLFAMGVILLLVFPLLVATIIDGVSKRLIKREEMHSENPRIYHLAKHIFLAVMYLPLVIVALPITIAPQLAVAWALLVIITAWGMAQNVEQEI